LACEKKRGEDAQRKILDKHGFSKIDLLPSKSFLTGVCRSDTSTPRFFEYERRKERSQIPLSWEDFRSSKEI
jgi:hypothetical protein